MKYKLGSQILLYTQTNGDDVFEWNLCMMGDNGVLHESVYLGDRSNRDPIISKARELVKLLNEEKV